MSIKAYIFNLNKLNHLHLMQKTTFLFSISFCFISMISLCNENWFKEDSIFIEKKFSSILVEPNKEDSIIGLITNKVDLENDSIADIFDFAYAKFLFRTGNFEKSLEITDKRIKNPYNIQSFDGKFYNLEGAIYSLNGEYNKAIKKFIVASNMYDKRGDELKAALIKNNIANIYFSLNEHEKAYKFILECYEVVKNYPDNNYYPSILAVLAISESSNYKLSSAKEHASQGLKVARERNDSTAIALLNYALGETNMKEGDFEKALPYLKIALSISKQFRLSQYQLLSNIQLMKLYNLIGDYQNALKHGSEAENLLGTTINKSTLFSIKSELAQTYYNLGDYKRAYNYRLFADSVSEKLRSTKIRANTDSLLIVFETEKKNIENQLLSKTVTQKNAEIKSQQYLFIAILALFLLLVIFIILFIMYKRAQLASIKAIGQRAILKALYEGEERERNRVSSQLHDGVASDLTALKMNLEQRKEIDSDVISKISNLHNDVRRISHDLSPIFLEKNGLVHALKDFCNQFNLINFYANVESVDIQSKEKKIILYRFVQEAINNAIKHAEASVISVQILTKDNTLTISIEDDGKGFDVNDSNFSVGLSGMESKIKIIGGELNIESSEGKGTTIFIKLKINE